MARKSKLSVADQKQIIAIYARGNITLKEIADKFDVSVPAIFRIIHSDPEFSKKCESLKEKAGEVAYNNLEKYFEEHQDEAADLVKRLLNIPDELIASSTLRERVGAASYIKDMFSIPGGADADEPINVTLTIKDLTEGAPDA